MEHKIVSNTERQVRGALFALICCVIVLAAGCNTSGLVPATPVSELPTSSAAPTATLELRPEPEISPTAQATRAGGSSSTRATSTTISNGSPSPTALAADLREQIFDEVWSTVSENYLYEDFNGTDWDAVREEYRPRALAAGDNEEFYSVVQEMIGELNDEHSQFLTPEEAQEEDDYITGNNSYVGIGVLASWVDNTRLVIFVFPGSPAEEAGLQRRDRITAVDGTPFADENDTNRIRGPQGSEVSLTVKSPGVPEREIVVTRRAIRGKVAPSAYRLKVEPSIGYVLVPDLMTEDTDTLLAEELSELRGGDPLEGIILDLRGNGGGLRTVLQGVLSSFLTGEAGSFYSQDRSHPLWIEPNEQYDAIADVPMAVLIDEGTQSNAEALAAVLQHAERAKVIGSKSAGNTESIYPYDFEDGSRLWVAEEGFKLPDGRNLEGTGVVPDTEMNIDWSSFTEREDPHILEAIRVLRAEDK